MSRGSKIVNVRFNDAELDAMQDEIDRYTLNPCNPHRTISEFIRVAVKEKIAHATRSRNKRKRKSDAADDSRQADEINQAAPDRWDAMMRDGKELLS